MIKQEAWCVLLVINLLLITPISTAQNLSSNFIDEVIENLSANNDQDEERNWENELMELSEQLQTPVNINEITKEQLEQFPFLSDIQIENILAYLYIHGQLATVYELQLIEEMDKNTIQYLLPFIYVLPVESKKPFPSARDIIKYSKQEVLTRLDIPLYHRKGYEKNYLGPPLYHSFRYGFQYRNQLYSGITAEKDAGEPFGALHNKKGYDHYSFYFLLRDSKRIKALALGNYRLSFGQGLVISTDYLMGKGVFSSSFNSRSGGIRKHASTDEYNYFRGVALTMGLTKHTTLSTFYSHRLLDGVVTDNEITSISKTGLHRTDNETDKLNAFTLQLTGGNLTYTNNTLKIGATGIYYSLNYPYKPDLKGYAKYNLHGDTFYNVGIDYAYRWQRFSLQGEAATGKSGFATLNRLNYSPVQGYQLTLIHRYYAYNYWAMFANSFSEGSSIQNENGWYVAIEATPLQHWKFTGSLDLFSFPWWRYRISKPSQGVDGLLQASYSPTPQLNMYASYRYKQKERDVTGTKGAVILPIYHHRLRYRLNYAPSDAVSLRTTVDYNQFCTQGQPASHGYQATQAVTYQLPWWAMKLSMQGSYFCTNDYDSRVYISEKGLLNTFYTPSFQGEGIRLAALLRYDINKYWMVIGKVGQTVYYDRQSIGSGNDLIDGNKKADVQLQLRIKF